MMKQFQIDRSDPTATRLVTSPADRAQVDDGDALIEVETFGFSANNITYVMLGDRLGYWRFFPAVDDDTERWGVVPVWGFGRVVEARSNAVAVGERLFGFFPTATHVVMTPQGAPERPVVDAAAHRRELPAGYNVYQRVAASPDVPADGVSPTDEELRMLLFPLYLTSWAINDQLEEANWHGAGQVIITSASSKTALGLAQALRGAQAAPPTLGVTSSRHVGFVEGLRLYDRVISYDDIEAEVAIRPTVIVDLAGNGAVLGRLHALLSESMLRSVHVGLTHWAETGATEHVIQARSEVFFAPAVIAKRMKEWGAGEFTRRSTQFVTHAMDASRDWLTIERIHGLEALTARYDDVRTGAAAPDRGLVVSQAR